jgi:uncharacterized protein (UPF0262 family)
MTVPDEPRRDRIARITLDERLTALRSPEQAHERRVAIHDLIEDNRFRLRDGPVGPYALHLHMEATRLVLDLAAADGTATIALPIIPFRRIVRDYLMILESYYEAIRTAPPSKIEAIDMGRRGLHDEGAELLQERLKAAAELDHATARRLFTLVCVLQARG